MANLVYLATAGESMNSIARSILGAGASDAVVNAVATGLASLNGWAAADLTGAGDQIIVPSSYAAYAVDPWFFNQQQGAPAGVSPTMWVMLGLVALFFFNSGATK